MARKREFPITIKAGSTAIRIYFSPQRVNFPNGHTKNYDSFLVAYYRGGKRHRSRFKEFEEAQTEAQRVQTLILNEDLVALQLTGRDQLIYVRAKKVVDETGVDLDVMAQEYADARRMLGTTSLQQAAEFFQKFGKTIRETKTIPVVVRELLSGLKTDNLSGFHVRDMTKRLNAFASAFPKSILDVNASEMVEWLRSLKKHDKKGKAFPMAPKTRNHYRNAVVQLFNFARDHGYLPKGLPTEAESLKAVKVTPSENEIFTIPEMVTLLQNARDYLVPALAMKAFSGIRTEEMVKIRWEHIHWENKFIRLPAGITKVTQRRLIPMPENLIRWLEPHKKSEGRIAERWTRSQALVQAFERHGKRLSIDVGGNKFRNSYISYRVAQIKDVQRVALESGNSPRVIQREYLELATEAEAKKWFEILPAGSPVPLPPNLNDPAVHNPNTPAGLLPPN